MAQLYKSFWLKASESETEKTKNANQELVSSFLKGVCHEIFDLQFPW